MQHQVPEIPSAFLQNPSQDFVANLRTRIFQCPESGFPVTVNDGKDPTCYINSPTRTFIDYGIEETRNFGPGGVLQRSLSSTISMLRPLLRATGWDRQVQINNWFLSTNPLPLNASEALEGSMRELCGRFPDHTIAIRSLNRHQHEHEMLTLERFGFRMVPMRQVYLWHPAQNQTLKKDLKRDLALARKSGLHWVSSKDFTDEQFAQSKALYDQLYLETYTPLNPQYTEAFLKEMSRAGALELSLLVDNAGTPKATIGLFRAGNTLTSPLVGYDTTRPQKEGLYRQLSVKAFQTAIQEGRTLNLSAGAASFKRNRGACPEIEYMAILDQHLPVWRRAAATTVEKALRGIAMPLLNRYEL